MNIYTLHDTPPVPPSVTRVESNNFIFQFSMSIVFASPAGTGEL